MAKLAKMYLSTDLLERIITAKDNDYVHTNAPQDLKIVRIVQDSDDQANHRVLVYVDSEEAGWPESKLGLEADIPLLDPFTYTVDRSDEDESPPTTQGESP
jgi:hypothetical protein